MIESMWTFSLTIAAIGAGLMAGVYFAFSGFIMRSFDQLAATQATDAMNAINEVILRSWFMPLFFGTTVLYALLSLIALLNSDLAGRWLVVTMGLVYVAGMFLCTALFNVPLNNRLASVKDNDQLKSEIWPLYFKQWTQWNHFRGVCSLVAFLLNVYYLIYYT
ncbi:MAG: DUF1772 domain-containing protein [Granulosicoccus sp.]